MSSGAEALVNRDTPIPVVQLHPADGSTPKAITPASESGSGPGHRLSATKLKDKLESLNDKHGHDTTSSKMADRMFNLLLSQVLPSEDLSDASSADSDTPSTPRIKDRRSHTYVARPNFSLPTMSSNFRRFNARIGVAFVLQNRLIRLFTWAQPTQTLSFLFVWTFVCVDPYLLPVLPLASLLFFVMVPSFLARHPEPEGDAAADILWRGHHLSGPPLAGARRITPAPEFSKDFFRNMRDLQNVMEDFSRAHDAVLALLTPPTNFSNEALSSSLYMLLLALSVALFISAHLLPWRAIALLTGYAATALAHPAVQDALAAPTLTTSLSDYNHTARRTLLNLSNADISISPPSSPHTVEIFELQHRTPNAPFEPFLFTPTPYAPLEPARISGARPRGTPFFEDVLPPRGWRWADKKWSLDLMSREWVLDRCVTGVLVEEEGERWVTDLVVEGLESEGRRKRGGGGDVGEQEREVLRRAWERSVAGRQGEWRRRRWVRGVERVGVE